MDSEEKEMLKRLLSKVEKLEEGMKAKDKEIEKLREEKTSTPSFPIENIKDPLARAILKGIQKKESLAQERIQTTPTLKELKEHHLGEIILFAKKKGIPLGHKEEESEGEIKVIVD